MGLVQTLGSAVSSTTQASISLTLTAATTAGNTLVISAIQASGSGFNTVVDSKGNSYVKVKQTSVGTSQTIASFVAIGAAALVAGDTITLTSAVTNQYPVLVAYEFTPVTASDASTSAIDSGTSSSTYAIPGVAIPAGDHLLIGVLGASGAGRTQTPSAGWTKLGANGDAAPTFPRTVMSMWGAQSGGTLAATGTFSASVRWCGHLLALPVPASSSTYPAAGTAPATTGVTGVIAAVLLAAGTLAGVSGTSGAPTVVRAPQAASGTATAVSGSTGSVHATRPSQAVTPASTAVAGTVITLRPTAGTASIVASTVGDPVVVGPADIPAAGTIHVATTVTGTVSLRGAPTGTIPATTGTAGTVTATVRTSGSTPAVSDTTAAPTLLTQAAGTVTAVTTTSGDPTNPSGYRDIDLTYTTAVDRWADSVPGDRWQDTTGDTRWAHTTRPDRWTHVTSPDRWE